jgi:Raf kinase inhibitor-like YbhB/YbcL family protein
MRAAGAILVLAAALDVTGCGGTTSQSKSSAARGPILVSSDFRPGAVIAHVHTCDGRDLSPPVHAAGMPAATKEVVVVMRDHDAPGGDFIHWGLAHIAPGSAAGSISLPPAAAPAGAVLGRNSFGSLGYRGPCPPSGSAPHHYEITVYALGRPSMLGSGFSADAAARLPALATGSLTGLFGRR